VGDMSDRTDVHSGHRSRLREKAKYDGIEFFQPHEVLELILMQIIPLRDVNPLAHGLMNEYGSLERVLTAPEKELMKVQGVGKRTAEWLGAFGEAVLAFCECWQVPQYTVDNALEAFAFLREHGIGEEGDFTLVCLDHTGRVLHQCLLRKTENGFPGEREMIEKALMYHAAQVFVIHYTDGREDYAREMEFALHASETFALVEIVYLDHIVVAHGQYKSARRSGVPRRTIVEHARAAECRSGAKRLEE